MQTQPQSRTVTVCVCVLIARYRSIYKIHFFILYNRDKAGNQLCAVLLLPGAGRRGRGSRLYFARTLATAEWRLETRERRHRRMFNSFPADVTTDGEVTETRPQ